MSVFIALDESKESCKVLSCKSDRNRLKYKVLVSVQIGYLQHLFAEFHLNMCPNPMLTDILVKAEYIEHH